MKLNPVLRIIPIVYDGLPNKNRFLAFCKNIVTHINDSDLFKHYGIRALFADDLTQFSQYLIKGQIPPKNLRYNSMDGWLTVGSSIRWQLAHLQTSEFVKEGSNLRYPNVDEGDILLAIIPLSIETNPETWAQESHFSTSADYRGSALKALQLIYHVRLVNSEGRILEEFFKEYQEENIAYEIVEDIAEEHLGIIDVQMETIRIKFGYEIKDKANESEIFKRLRVLFYGNDVCSNLALKRAILLFDDIHFHDRPSYKITGLMPIGAGSRIRPYLFAFAKEEVPILVHKGLSGWLSSTLDDAVANEIEDKRFSKVFFEGFKEDANFRNLFIQEDGDYSKGKGYKVSEAIMKLDLGDKPYDLNKYREFTVKPFDPDSQISLEETFVNFLVDAAMKLNLCCALSHENDLIPFTEYPTLQKLLALRYKRIIEKGELPRSSFEMKFTHLSFKIFDSIIPTEMLENASITDVIKYRRETRDKYEDFRNFLMKLNAEVEAQLWDDVFEEKIKKIIYKEVVPAATKFEKECKRIWEAMIGDISKDAIKAASITGLSSFVISCFTGVSWIDIFIKGCGLAAPVVLPHIIDYAKEKRNLQRQNSLAYLTDLKRTIG